jgi:hypothetical protein
MRIITRSNSSGSVWKRTIFRSSLFQLHAYALGAVKQAPQMEASQRVVGVQPDQGGEGRHRRNIAGFELGEGFGILCRRRTFERRRRQRLEGAKRLAATTQHQIADRPPSEIPELSATAALTQMRVPRNLLAASSRAAILIVSP